MTTTLACNFPGCEANDLKPETALVPAIKAIQQAEGGRPVALPVLARHVFCQEHGALGRALAGGMFSYTETAKRLEQRIAERAAAKQFFAKYAEASPKSAVPGKPPAKPQASKTAMQIALEKGGVVKSTTPKVVKLPPAAAAVA